jgi:hypothetical protein
MTKEELININGGAAINASWLNALSRGVETLYNLGRSLGTIIKYLVKGTRC